MTNFFAVLVLSFGLNVLANNKFMHMAPAHDSELVGEDSILTSFLSEIERSLPDAVGTGKALGKASNHVSKIEATLGPIYAALAKNQYGNIDHISANYALHRLFVARHGWSIKGLEPSAGKHNASSPAGVLKDQVPAYIEEKFEQRLNGKGFKLHELAVLAATIEHLIQEEAVTRLGSAFKIHDTLLNGTFSEDYATGMLDTFITGFIISENLATKTAAEAEKLVNEMPDVFLFWRETQAFVRGVQQDITKSSDELNFGDLSKVAEAVGDQFGKFFDDTVCKKTKDALIKMEHRGTGSVRLSDFYKPAVEDGNWQFQESVPYLRELGVLEESNPDEPRVMIANYMVGPSNCIASSGFYAVCCKNECEGLLGHLEEKIAAPEATPETLAALVAALPSSQVLAPRILSDTSLQRLNEIAATHGGTVPLHGRLFGQWMHHAYPLECPYPHVSGTTDPKLPEEWLRVTGDEPTASIETMKQHMQSSTDTTSHMPAEDLMPWSQEEELLVVRPVVAAPQATSARNVKFSMGLLAVAGTLAYACMRMLKVGEPYEKAQKFVV